MSYILIGDHSCKVHIFWEGHKILRSLPLTFDCMYCSQKLGEDFAKFCGLLRIYELYLSVLHHLDFRDGKIMIHCVSQKVCTKFFNTIHKHLSANAAYLKAYVSWHSDLNHQNLFHSTIDMPPGVSKNLDDRTDVY